MKNLISNRGAWWSIAVALFLIFPGPNPAKAELSVHELNSYRVQAGLPPLAGHPSDLDNLEAECHHGIEFSCELLEELTALYEWNPAQDVPEPNSGDIAQDTEDNTTSTSTSTSSSPSVSPSNQYYCNNCRKRARECWSSQSSMRSAVNSAFMGSTCKGIEQQCAQMCR